MLFTAYSSLQTPNKGDYYVSRENQEASQRFLRLLDNDLAGRPGIIVDEKVFDSAISSVLTCHPVHQEIIFNSLTLYLSVFSGTLCNDINPPLWLELALRKEGLRLVSGSWLAAVSGLFRSFGLSKPQELLSVWVKDPKIAYSLGDYGFASDLNRQLPEGKEAKVLQQKIELFSDQVANKTFDPDAGCLLNNSLAALSMVIAAKSGVNFNSFPLKTANEHHIQKLRAGKYNNDSDLLRLTHCLNSENFLHQKSGFIKSVRANLETIEYEIHPNIKCGKTANHVLGITRYHSSTLSVQGSNEKLVLLNDAIRLDYGFSDYFYVLAQVYHDRKNISAAKAYERALETSPIYSNLVNDYGCFLFESKDHERLESWKKIARLLGQCGEVN